MKVELFAHFEDMVEQLMIAKGIATPSEVVEQAVASMYDTLSDGEKDAAVNRMVEDGFASGISEKSADEIFEGIFSRLRELRAHQEGVRVNVSNVHEAA